MRAAAIEKSRERLRRGALAIEGMEKANNATQFAECWEALLVALKAIGEILRTGAKGHNPSEIFLKDRWTELSADPLIKYLLEARNVEEHGLEPTAKFESSRLTIGGPGEAIRINGNLGPGGSFQVTPLGGSKVTITYQPSETTLLPVTDRSGQLWPVPETHFSNPIRDQSPISISRLGLTVFSTLVTEAAAFV